MRQFMFVATTTYQYFLSSIYAKALKQNGEKKIVVVCVGMNEKIINEYSNHTTFFVPDLNGLKICRFWKRLYYGGTSVPL